MLLLTGAPANCPLAAPATAPESPSLRRLRLHFQPTLTSTYISSTLKSRRLLTPLPISSIGTSVEHILGKTEQDEDRVSGENEGLFDFDAKLLEPPPSSATAELEVKELAELPEQWRRAKLAWLCKELPAHKSGTVVRVLNAQRKWLRQEDATYVIVHCLRIRQNETGFKVYKWMMQQHWYKFNFALATKLADYLGKERKFARCREVFDHIIEQGRVPSESTFHILTVAYLSSSGKGSLEEACSIYNRMIQLGGYQPQLSLHNALFRALVSGPGPSSKHYLKQAEYMFHNLVTSGLEVHGDVYGGLVWLHSYQDIVDWERIRELRKDMREGGIEESKEVLLSVLRACSKVGEVEEAERTWVKLIRTDISLPPLAYVYKMEVYAKVGECMKSFQIFQEMKEYENPPPVAAYHEIIEVLCKARNVELAESMMAEFLETGLKPLTPSYMDLLNMYLNLSLHEKLKTAFNQCLEHCQVNSAIYGIYLDSLVSIGNLEKADEIFDHMNSNDTVGVSKRSCNSILRGYLSSGDIKKAEKIYELMCRKKYEVEASLMEKLDDLLRSRRRTVKRKPISLNLSQEQREMLVGMLLGGLRIESDDTRKNHILQFEFNENLRTHASLKNHIHERFHEYLHSSSNFSCFGDEIPYRFSTVAHSKFAFFADHFWSDGKPAIPKLIHRWISPRVLAYWYMYGGRRTSSGDILLKLRGSREGLLLIIKSLKSSSLDCRVKRKGITFWIGLLGDNSTRFMKLIQPYVLDDFRDSAEDRDEDMDFDGGSETDKGSDCSDNDS